MHLLLASLLLACAEPPVASAPVRAIAALEISPGDRTVRTHADGGDGLQFAATVTWDDGEVEDGTTLVEWSVSNETAGTIDDSGWFQPGTTGGGVTWVTAALAGVEATATVTVLWEEERVEEGAHPEAFDAATATVQAELWLYPEDGVNLPRNTPGITFQWAPPAKVTPESWRLRFRSALTEVTVYTAASSWTADEETWQAITSTNAGGSLDLSLAAVAAGTVYEALPREVTVNRLDARGAIVYWSSSAGGFMEIPYGEPAQDYLTQAQTGYCVACHAISAQGDVAFTYDGGNGRLGVKDAEGQDLVAYDSEQYGNFKAWSPDGSRMLSTFFGDLRLWDATTWTVLGSLPITGGTTHPDWSPDGTQVVFTHTDALTYDWVFSGGSIAVVPVLADDQWGPMQVLYTPPAGWNAYYPAFSPDGEWISFNLSTGDSYNDLDAELWVIPAAGGAAIRLDAANQGASLTNSWSRWGPLPDDDILWLAFSSTRAYGAVTVGNPQIWVAAFDPAVAEVGGDPSYPAFWLPDQDPAQNNHVPVWTQ
ncbi:hypothetical protein L6R53_01525 [Myxococcota bacterium]|nr:hypothetical protein [Myxococcota bacterium]